MIKEERLIELGFKKNEHDVFMIKKNGYECVIANNFRSYYFRKINGLTVNMPETSFEGFVTKFLQ